jgi:ADP-heptose:LPS heptosyltransferase
MDRKRLLRNPLIWILAAVLVFFAFSVLFDDTRGYTPVDTSVAHLAGALGRPTFVMLPFSPDWRWTLAAEHSPWYPRTRLFRQQSAGDWRSVIASVRDALTTFA